MTGSGAPTRRRNGRTNGSPAEPRGAGPVAGLSAWARLVRVWIDLSNSPHPLLFEPVARRLEELGHEVVLSARDNAQTVQLARERWPDARVIGGPSPAGKLPKAIAMGRRVLDLCRFARETRPDVALSHNSYGQIVAARLLRLPVVTAMDFEHQPANHLAFRLADKILLPVALRDGALRKQGATPDKTYFYDGLKEELYLGGFSPDREVARSLGIDAGELVVVARPAPERAVYHQFGNPLFLEAVRAVAKEPGVRCVVLPRHPEQRRALAGLGLPGCVLPERAVDSRSLMQGADLMIGAGGTMTREAALLGVPTFTLFAGKQPAVDRWLEGQGLLRRLQNVDQLFPLVRKEDRSSRLAPLGERSERLVEAFSDAVLEAAR
jgi:uncharacterized protein